jgi:L-seryl-tRNA(Ser) seleniumtransferase
MAAREGACGPRAPSVYSRSMPKPAGIDPRRLVPSVDQLLTRPELLALVAAHGRPAVLAQLRAALHEIRDRAAGGESTVEEAVERIHSHVALRLAAADRPSLRRVINATGVVVHTNLGRAPLAARAAERVAEVARAYSNLEYDLETGDRGNREVHAEGRLRELLGAESTVVVNNCAAAVLLAVNTLAEGKEVLVSRGELVEIGGSFRIPDVLGKGGARLREVGTTNRTRLADYQAALSAETGLVLKVHPSNFRVVGFTEEAPLADLARLARTAGIPLVLDQGHGLLESLPAPLHDEAPAREALAAGVDAVCFSGDKLLGGPQAGLVGGRRAILERMRRNPLYRALRVDKMTLAALDATLVEHAAGRAATTVPVLRMIGAPLETLRERAQRLRDAVSSLAPSLVVSLVDGDSAVGGGAAPLAGVPTVALAIDPGPRGPDRFAAALREASPPVVVRVSGARVLVDLRTVDPEEEDPLRDALAEAALRA